MASNDNSDLPPLTDNERLIKTLQTCFSDLLEQQREGTDKLHNAIEALKSKAPTTDKKTKFWNAYKTLADEHDKEFQQRYSTDLDTSLIFAGLFSAVDSAFIIQIQPEIQRHNTPPTVLVAQSFLYISLFSTLLAALLAVLGKQWLSHYLAAGGRGTIEARGLERQRKFDGVQKWKFDTVMQMFPFLLQIGLFLFSAALSIYLWRIHPSLAIIVLSFTAFGFLSYTSLLVSAIISPDCPFQTPLVPLVAQLLPTTLWMKCKAFLSWATKPAYQFSKHIYSACAPCFQQPHHLLPFFAKHRSPQNITEQAAILFHVPFPDSSPEVPAVLWVLETSTDPHMIAAAAEIAYDLQWSPSVNVTPQQTKLQESFLACFEYSEVFWDLDLRESRFLEHVRDGMSLPALHLGRACWALQETHILTPRMWAKEELLQELEPELANWLRIVNNEPQLIFNSGESAIKWALHVIPSLKYKNLEARLAALQDFLDQFKDTTPDLDSSSFTDYLCCINSLLSTMNRCDTLRKDKSQFQSQLFEHILKTLISLMETHEISTDIAANIIETTGRLASKSETTGAALWSNKFYYGKRMDTTYIFCYALPQLDGWIKIVLATGLLTGYYSEYKGYRAGDPGWVYKALEGVCIPLEAHYKWDSRTVSGVSGLLQALHYYAVPPLKLHLPILFRALSMSGDISMNAARLLVQENIVDWFQDEELCPILQSSSVWKSLARGPEDCDSPSFCEDFICLGYTLANIPNWPSHIHKELCGWITAFFQIQVWPLAEKYNSVLSMIWNPDAGDYEFSNNREKALGLSFIALSNTWEGFDFGALDSLKQSVSWLHCTRH